MLLLKLSLIFLASTTTVVLCANRKQTKKLCNSLNTFCDHCQMQSGNCNRVRKDCDATIREKTGDPMELSLCRQVRAQCNLCKNQGRNCRNLQRQCNPGNATTTKPPSQEMNASSQHQNQGQMPIETDGEPILTLGNATSPSGGNKNNTCRKFGMRCQKRNPCCQGLRCSAENSQTKAPTCVMVNSKDHSEEVMQDVIRRGNNNRNRHQEEISFPDW